MSACPSCGSNDCARKIVVTDVCSLIRWSDPGGMGSLAMQVLLQRIEAIEARLALADKARAAKQEGGDGDE